MYLLQALGMQLFFSVDRLNVQIKVDISCLHNSVCKHVLSYDLSMLLKIHGKSEIGARVLELSLLFDLLQTFSYIGVVTNLIFLL